MKNLDMCRIQKSKHMASDVAKPVQSVGSVAQFAATQRSTYNNTIGTCFPRPLAPSTHTAALLAYGLDPQFWFYLETKRVK
ncbi:hypothetical protein J6590_057881 [Homalodisca vitripennis]|nr:hypothetical protein J6590_057881 [Homalodisca vitripennis]